MSEPSRSGSDLDERPYARSDQPASPVHSWDEFTRLREVVIGHATGAKLPDPKDPSAWLNLYPELDRSTVDRLPQAGLTQRVIEETEEDLGTLCRELERAGVSVRRTIPSDQERVFGTPDWQSSGMYAYCPRDVALILGETAIETPSPTRARYFEVFSLSALFQEYLEAGANWIAAPKSRLGDDLYATKHGHVGLTNVEVAFEAANVLRLGRDLIYQVSSSGNELGLTWLRQIARLIGDLRVHPIRGVYDYTHIDSTIAPLRPGLVLLNPARLSETQVPEFFSGWDVLWCPPPPETGSDIDLLSSPWISMNLLMVDTDLAVADAGHPELVRMLERAGISTIPLRLRHARALGGGFHCVSLDIRRDGGLEDYSVG